MKFENVGKWMKEAEEDKLVFDNREPADFLDGDDEICTLKTEDDESDYDDDFSGELLDEVESEDFEDELDSPENEEDTIVMSESMPPINQRKRIEFEDDIVRVYDGNKEIYAGAEDYEPMQDEDWKWDNANKYYKFGKYIKVCCESSQKNEGFDTYAVAWKEFDRQDRVIGKQKEFKTAAARDSFIKKLQEHQDFMK